MLDAFVLDTTRDKGADDTPVNWAMARAAEALMEEAGLFPVNSLTRNDVRGAYDERLTDDQCEEVIWKIQKKAEWDWADLVDIYASSMYPKSELPGEDPDNA